MVDDLLASGDIKAAEAVALREQLKKIKPVDVSALRKSIEAELRAKIQPSVQKTITTENGPVIADLKNKLSNSEADNRGLKKRVATLEEVKGKKNKAIWMLVGVVFLLTAWTTKGLWFPAGAKALSLLNMFRK